MRTRAILLIVAADVTAALLTTRISSFGAAPSARSAPPPESQTGQQVYEQQCAACHGVNGDGRGPASVWLYPKPRDFNLGLFKLKSTPGQALPTDEDLLRSVTRGLPGSGMPAFSYLSEQQRRDVAQYVKFLTATIDAAGKRVNRFEQAAAQGELAKPIDVPPEPPNTIQELTLGRDMYQKMQCFNCHGQTGAGDGPQVPTLKDAAGIPVRPRDFNTGSFRGGASGPDLYTRIFTGLAGTPMIPYGDDVLKPAERWALVHYLQSLRRPDVSVNDLLTPEDSGIRAKRIQKLPADAMDGFWETLDPVRVPLNPLWPEPDPVYAVAVTAVHDGNRLAVLCQWRDALPNGAPVRVQDFQDAFAMQFSLTGQTPFLGMGDKDNPVNIWQWKAGWQAEAEGHRQDMQDEYQAMHVDTYFQEERHFATALDAGNVIAQPHRSSVEDANARGFGSFTSQPMAQQNVQGKGVWRAGFWNVVFFRDLKSPDTGDVELVPGKPIPVAIAVWNGEQHDRNGRKVVSNWYQLVLE